MSDIETIKELRDQTGLSMGQISKALKEAGGDKTKALELLAAQAGEAAAKKGDRVAKDGVVAAYIHTTGKVGALVALACETDFVARNDHFKELARELAMHATAMRPADAAEMLTQPFVKNPDLTVQDMINQAIAKLGENIKLASVAIQVIG
jgi:elongation factor Ts